MTVKLSFQKITPDRADTIATLLLNRPEASNAFNPDVIRELGAALRSLRETTHCRIVLMRGAGKHFSGGADLNWMKDSANLSYQENLEDARRLMQIFEDLHQLPMPTIAVVKGSAYGGAVGLTAACDLAIALPNTRFCLSEVSLGILPAVILPYLARKIAPTALRRISLTAAPFSGSDALAMGLVTHCVPEADLRNTLVTEISNLLQAGPKAIATLKHLHLQLANNSFRQDPITAETIAKARVGEEAQAGFRAFFAKKSADWKLNLPAEFPLDEA